MRSSIAALVFTFAFAIASANESPTREQNTEWDPHHPNAEEMLEEFDRVYEEEMGYPPFIEGFDHFEEGVDSLASGCRRHTCAVYVEVHKGSQRAHLFLHGRHEATWNVSTGKPLGRTPNMDRHPNGRIYDRYTSRSYPGGDYNGLGNMPYAVFIRGPYAIHGTPKENWAKLGQPASKGCIRLHPEHAKRLNRLVRHYGVKQTWFLVH